MSKNDWNTIESILDRVLKLPDDQQLSYLNAVCEGNTFLYEEVLSLLLSIRESDETGFLQQAATENRVLIEDLGIESSRESFIGRRIGAFEITERIGTGGMGSVFKAERADGQFKQEVAIKLIRKEFYTKEILRRFELEKKILAGLSHPNIARLFDGGMTGDGHPYLIMEYIDGMPVDAYSNNKKLTVDQRIDLCKNVCKAVEYAHQNLVIHRDLKAQNIYVTTDGQVKILDFGIAKLLNPDLTSDELIETKPGQQFWTPQYAAPEQVKGQSCTTATDVYALGVLLHKLLTDCYPLDLKNKNKTTVQEIISKTAPTSPSASVRETENAKEVVKLRKTDTDELIRNLKGDLDALVLKCVRKEPEHRYTSVGQLLEDIERYTAGRPLLARSDTLKYRSAKFMRRHKTALGFTAAIILMLVTFAGIYTFKINKERDQARAEAEKAELVTSFLIGLFEASDPTKAQGDTVTARDLLERGIARAEALENQPGVQSQMFETIGRVYRRLGRYDKSRNLLKKALDNRQSNYGASHIETASSLDHLGMLLSDEGAYNAAEKILRKSLHIRAEHQGPAHPALAETQSHLAYALRKQGFYQDAEKLYRSSLQIRKLNYGTNHPKTVAGMSSLGTTLHNMGNYKATEELYRQVLALNRDLLGSGHPDVAMNLNNLGALLMNIGQFEEATKHLQEALAIRTKVYGRSHPKVALTMNNLAIVLKDMREFAAAESLFSISLSLRMELLGKSHMETAMSQFALADLMLQTSRADSALTLYRDAMIVFKEKLHDNHSLIARTTMGMGNAKLAMGYAEEAELLLNAGFEQIQTIHTDTTLEKALAERELGIFYLKQNNLNRADSLLKEAYTTLQLIEGKGSPRQKQIMAYLKK